MTTLYTVFLAKGKLSLISEDMEVTSSCWNQGCYEMNLRIKASPYHHSAEVPESVLTANYEKGFVKIRVILSQLLLLDFPFEKMYITLSVTHYPWQKYPLHFVLFFMLTLNTFNFIQRTVNTENVHSNFWFLNTFSFQLVPFFLGSSLSHCLLSVHFCISLCWSARRKMIPFNRGLKVVIF